MNSVRIVLGHVGGLGSALAAATQGPRITDFVVCGLAASGMIHGTDLCVPGSARLGEGGLSLNWSVAVSLLGLVAIMETFLWLSRWYGAPAWSVPVVVLIGAPAVLAGLLYFSEPAVSFALFGALLLGLPIAFIFTAYWAPLIMLRPSHTVASGGTA